MGLFLLFRAEKRPIELASFRKFGKGHQTLLQASLGRDRRENAFERASTRRRVFSASFPTLLDDYVLRDFFVYLGMILSTFLVLVLVFTLFELLGDILAQQSSGNGRCRVSAERHAVSALQRRAAGNAAGRARHLRPDAALERNHRHQGHRHQHLPHRHAGDRRGRDFRRRRCFWPTSSICLTPTSARKRCTTRSKASPPQTYLRPDRKWIFGQNNDIYYYQFFDPDRDQFGNITVFQLDKANFTITRRIHADRARWAENLNRWEYEQGWERTLNVSAIANYRPFEVATFPELPETPSYFKKEVKQYSEMNYEELRRYIRDLQQSGFDVVRLRVELHKKLSYPLITLIMAVLAIPFSLSTGKQGAVTGVAVAVGIAVFYTVVSRLFEAMGDLSQLPPALAAWSPDLIFMLVGGYLILKVPT